MSVSVNLVYSPTLAPVTCQPTPLVPVSFDLLGGGKFVLQILGQGESKLRTYARSLFGLNSSLSSTAPAIKVLLIVAAIVKIVRGLATLPGGAGDVASGISQLGVSAADLVTFVNFPISLARTVLAIRANLVGFLQQLKTDIITIQSRYTNVNGLISDATTAGNAAMLANAICAKERLDAKVAELNAMLVALGVALQLFSVILCLVVPGAHFNPLPTLDPNNLVTAAIDDAIAVLNALAIPDVPGVSLSC